MDNNTVDTDFRTWLKLELDRCNLSQAELARMSGVPQPTIQRIISGETGDPRGSTMAKLRGVLGDQSHIELLTTHSNSHLELIERIHARLDHFGWGWADLARAMGLTEQRVNNWRTRGVPARELRNVELALKLPRYALDVAEAQTAEIAVNAALETDESELLKAWAYLLPAEKESVMEQIRPMAAHNKAVLEHYRESSVT